MRKIYVADSACTDEALMWVADQNPLAALVWPWFLLSLDDWGRGSANPRQLRARLFPENTLVTAELLSEALDLYAQAGLVTLYQEAGGRRLVAIAPEKWFRYQTHIRSEKRTTDGSRFPAPTADDARDCARPREDARTSRGCCASPSALLPFCPSPSPSPSQDSSSSNGDDGFSGFWESYPRKTHRLEALRQWERLSTSDRSRATAAAGHLAAHLANGHTEREFIPYPARFLGPSRLFEDWADGPPEGERPTSDPGDEYCPFCGGLVTPDEDLVPHCSACHRRFTP